MTGGKIPIPCPFLTELELAEKIMAGFDVCKFPFYKKFARKAKYLNVKRGKTITYVGCGPFPITIICLWKECGVKSIGIEREVEFADISRKVIEKLGFSEYIKIVHGDETLLPLNEDKILYAPGLEPLGLIL